MYMTKENPVIQVIEARKSIKQRGRPAVLVVIIAWKFYRNAIGDCHLVVTKRMSQLSSPQILYQARLLI